MATKLIALNSNTFLGPERGRPRLPSQREKQGDDSGPREVSQARARDKNSVRRGPSGPHSWIQCYNSGKFCWISQPTSREKRLYRVPLPIYH